MPKRGINNSVDLASLLKKEEKVKRRLLFTLVKTLKSYDQGYARHYKRANIAYDRQLCQKNNSMLPDKK